MNIVTNSLYEKLYTGKALVEFPTDYFGRLEHSDGSLIMQSSRWLRTNNLETYYEWVIPFDKNLNMIEDFQNGYFALHQYMTIMCIRSRQNNQCAAEVHGIYDMTSQAFTEIYIDENGNTKNTSITPSSTYRWRNGDAMVKTNNQKLIRKIIPVSKPIDSAEIFGSTLSNIREKNLTLPSVI